MTSRITRCYWQICSVALVVFIAVLTSGTAQAMTIEDTSFTGIQLGDRIRMDTYHRQKGGAYDSVGIVQLRDGNNFFDNGTGTLINNQWVLTAAHVVTDADEIGFVIDGKTYKANRWFVHKGYDGTVIGNGRDIALIKLSKPIKGASVSKIAPKSATGGLKGNQVTTVGYGGWGTGLTGHGSPYPFAEYDEYAIWGIEQRVARAGNNVVDEFYGQWALGLIQGLNKRIFTMDFDSSPAWAAQITNWIDDPDEVINGSGFADRQVSLETSTIFGDSGGPTFNDKGQIVGVTSWGQVVWYEIGDDVWVPLGGFYQGLNLDGVLDGARSGPDSSFPPVPVYYSQNGFTNVALHYQWIKQVIRNANTAGGGAKLAQLANFGSTTKGGIDSLALLSAYGIAPGSAAARNNMNITNFSMRDFMQYYQVPEPSAILLLSAGSLALLRRRRAD